jgi:hypothetical protein
MKKFLTLATIAACVLAATSRTASAQSQTDEVMAMNIQLTMVIQGPTTTTRNAVSTGVTVVNVTTRDVINALGAATGNTFNKNAKLVLLTPTNSLDYWLWTFQVQDGNVAVDVTGFFSHQPGQSVGSATLNTRNGNAASTDYSIDSFSVNDAGGFPSLSLHFSGGGFTTTSSHGVVQHGQVVGQIDRLTASVSGTGDYQGNYAVVTGSISANGIGTENVAPPIVTN